MSSGASQATLNFPTGIDIYSTKVDRGVIVSGESHTIPLVAPYQFFLDYVPQSGTITIPAYTEVSSSPVGLQYAVTYSGTNSGLVEFDLTNAGVAVSATYTANGDVVRAYYFNDLQDSVLAIENFIVSGLGISGNYLPVTGGSMNGSITMNGANILTSVASGNQVGTSSAPFAQVHSNVFYANSIQGETGASVIDVQTNASITTTNNATINAANITETATSTISMTAAADINITSTNTNFIGSVKPTVGSLYNLGGSSNRWATVYADNLDVPGFSGNFVSKAGDSMTGDLNMNSGSAITVDNIENNSGNLLIDSSNGLTLSANNISLNSDNGVTITPAALNSVSIAGSLDVYGDEIDVSSLLVPTASGIDIGTTGMYFGTVYASNFVGGGLSGNFVSKSGDTMTGDLTMGNPLSISAKPIIHVENIESLLPSGALNVNVGELAVTATNNIHFDVGPSGLQTLEIGTAGIYFSNNFVPTSSGTYDLGSPSLYIDTVYANNITATSLTSGVSLNGATLINPTVTGTMAFVSGSTIGSSGAPLTTLYVDTIISNVATGTYLLKAGDTIQGNLLTNASGSNNIGSAAVPFAAIYANNINSTGLDGRYVLKTGDTMTGPLSLQNIQSTGSLTISGVNNLNTYFNQTSSTAEQHNITSTVGPVIIDANTELQQLVNSTTVSVLSATGTELYANIFPDTSGSHTVGTPSKPFAAIYADFFVPTTISGTGNFVLKVGDSMTGDLTMIGADILTSASGTNDIGSAANPFANVYANNLSLSGSSLTDMFVNVTGDSMSGPLSVGTISNLTNINSPGGLLILSVAGSSIVSTAAAGGNVVMSAGGGQVAANSSDGSVDITANTDFIRIAAQGSGVKVTANVFPSSGLAYNLGTASNRWSGVYAGSVDSTNLSVSGSLNPAVSGVGVIGTIALPWSGLWVKNINGSPATKQVYNEVPSGVVNGVNDTFYTIYSAVSGTERLFKGGLRMSPGNDYSMSGSGITFSGASIPTSGTNLLIDYERLAF